MLEIFVHRKLLPDGMDYNSRLAETSRWLRMMRVAVQYMKTAQSCTCPPTSKSYLKDLLFKQDCGVMGIVSGSVLISSQAVFPEATKGNGPQRRP